MAPALAVLDEADLRSADPEFARELNALAADGGSSANLSRGFGVDLSGHASLAVLHRAVPPHVHLVFPMGSPAKIEHVVVPRITVVVRDVRMRLRGRRPEKSRGHETMDGAPGTAASLVPQDHRDVAIRRFRSGQYDRRWAPA